MQRMKKWKVIKLTLFCMEKTLNGIEYLITPSGD